MGSPRYGKVHKSCNLASKINSINLAFHVRAIVILLMTLEVTVGDNTPTSHFQAHGLWLVGGSNKKEIMICLSF